MSLIINQSLPMLMKGYPTVSDKYNVSGAVLEGSTAVQFGDLVKLGTTKGYFEAAAGATNVNQIAGFVVATNVKLAENFPGTTVQVNPGEAFNLSLPDTFMAVELDSAATPAQITPNAQVAVILATGKVTTADKIASTTIAALPNVVFTGVYENKGTSSVPKYLAEVYIK